MFLVSILKKLNPSQLLLISSSTIVPILSIPLIGFLKRFKKFLSNPK